ncbi:MAG: GGDEF domain-containing protein [Rubrivivax sp.]|nr:MAG: GGDEF domain-containing protein [Rubrivivax sp.]
MSVPLSPPSLPRKGLLHRMLLVVDGQLALLPPRDRARLVAWQELRTRAALGQLFTLLTVAVACKVALIVVGVWPVGLPAWQHVAALLLLVLAQWVYRRARHLPAEGLGAFLFLVGLVVIMADPSPGWTTRPAPTLGWVWLLAALAIPVLARLRSVVVFSLLLVAVAVLYFAMVPAIAHLRLPIALYMSIAISGGILLRRLRSDMTLNHYRSNAEVTATANSDPLTLLANRRGWRELAPLLLADCAEMDRPISLLFIDLDHFKQLNDLHGHATGDEALRRVGLLLRERIGQGLAARLGGEEFVCLLPGMDTQAAMAFASTLRAALMSPPIPLTFSGGVVQWQPGEALPELLARGDSIMYRAKQAGRDLVMAG